MDYIRREDLREEMVVVPSNTYEQGWNDALRSVYRNAPSVDSWIPVSERLPEDRRAVLVTAYWHETYQVMEASYYGDGLWWYVPFNNCGEHMQQLKPKAWMPLPEPYKAEKKVSE